MNKKLFTGSILLGFPLGCAIFQPMLFLLERTSADWILETDIIILIFMFMFGFYFFTTGIIEEMKK